MARDIEVEPPFLRSAYNYDMKAASDASGINCQVALDPESGELVPTPSLAKQSFADECDINTIVRRFGLLGEMPVGVRMPTFADFTDVPSYHEAMNAIREADEAFYSMPAEVRARFHNDAGEFVEFCSNESNRDEARKMGLLMPEAAALAAPAATASTHTVVETGGTPVVVATPSTST